MFSINRFAGEENKSSYSEHAIKLVLPEHAWAEHWVIRVSVGLTEVVCDLLTNIEDVMGDIPDLSYLRITDEVNETRYDNELSALYQRKLLVFIQAKELIEARDDALAHAVKNAVIASLSACCICGDKLQLKNLKDEGERKAWLFLPQLPDNKNADVYSSAVNICLSCAYKAWKYDQETEVKVVDPLDAWASICPEDENSTVDCNSAKPAEAVIDAKEKKQSEADAEVAQKKGKDVKCKKGQVAIFSFKEVDQLAADYADAARDHANRIKGLVKKLRNTSANKMLVTIPTDWRVFCENLALNFPNFIEVVDFMRNQLALSAASDNVLRLPPFLLTGNPGIGKTEFALTIATELKTRLEVIDMASAQTGMGLSGSESHWSTSQPGALFNALMFNKFANPIVMLDEIDKARGDKSYNPLAALHQLLEPRQAKRFRDLSVPELNVDASHVIWIATANTCETIDNPIVDRFTVFNIADPSTQQMPAIVINQYNRFINNNPCGNIFESEIRADVLDELCKHHPRKVRKLLEQSFGSAAIHDRSYLTVEDVKASETGEKRKAGIGFMSESN